MKTFLIRHLVFQPNYWEGEDSERYQPGGYHPIIIGDILSSSSGTSSYRMFMKLGHGSFSTVWLAENLNSTPKYVAVKVSTADDMSNNEASYLRSMSSPFIAPVLDSFSLDGPNGRHYVLVTEVMLPLLDFLATPHTLETCKTIIWQLVKAVEQLHAAGLIHGDLHVRNAGVTFPDQLQSVTLWQILLRTEYPVLIPILLDSNIMAKRPASLPPYVTCRCDLTKVYKHLTHGRDSELLAKLFDFGSVRRTGDAGVPLVCSKLSRAPEIVHAVGVDNVQDPVLHSASDIWALGTVIFEIMTGFPIFSQYDLVNLDKRVLVNDDEWWERISSKLKGCSDNVADCDTLVDLLKKIFVLDPSKRPSAAAIADDDWFSDIRPVNTNIVTRQVMTAKDL